MKKKNNSRQLNIIIIGFGSIGRRHYNNLSKLGYKNIAIFDTNQKMLDACEGINKIGRLGVEALRRFDVAFICNPNNMHITAALDCARAGCHLFIEKPLSHNMKRVDELAKICAKNKLVNMTACNIRFNRCVRYMHNYLERKKLGKLYGIDIEFGNYLPYWRPKQDYRKNYAAKKSTGGGIILDDVHSFDLLFWLNNFKKVKESKFIYGKISGLEIETEDMCFASFKFGNKVLGSVRVDYLQQPYVWKCKIIGEKGNLEWSFKEDKVWLKTNTGDKALFQGKNFDVNRMYVDEVKYFFNCVNSRRRTFNDIKTAAGLLKYCVERI